MPYVHPDLRAHLHPYSEVDAEHPGELNFQLTVLIDNYLQNNGMSYQSINDCLGALEGAKLEAYRRVFALYEDTKIEVNGDVYTQEG